jgi:FG-GAP-like repeat
MRKQFLVISALVFIFGTTVFGQSIDINRPTPIASNVLAGTVKGNDTNYYSLRAKKGTLLIVRATATSLGEGVQGSIAFHHKDGGIDCCSPAGYLAFAVDSGKTVSKKFETSFTVLTNDSFIMDFNFAVPESSPMTFRITFEGLEVENTPVPVLPTVTRPSSGDMTEWFLDTTWCSSPNSTLYSADFNGDNRTDLMCREPNRISIDYADADGQFSGTDWSRESNWCTHPNSKLSLGDFNGDNRTDLLCKDPKRLWISYADANGQF